MSSKSRGLESNTRNFMSSRLTVFLCFCCFCAGMLFTNRMSTLPGSKDMSRLKGITDEKLNLVSDGCNSKADGKCKLNIAAGEGSKTHNAIHTLDKTISDLEMELAAARAAQDSILTGSPISEELKVPELSKKRKYLMVVEINTGFSCRKRTDSVRATWMLQGNNRKRLQEENGHHNPIRNWA